MAIFYVVAGVNHFVSPEFYRGIMPSYIPWPAEMIAVTGVAEILGGIGVLVRWSRTWAARGLIALLIAILPVHIQMALDGYRSAPPWILWARLPFQAVLIAWVYWCCLAQSGRRDRALQ